MYLQALFQPGVAWSHFAGVLFLLGLFLAAQICRWKSASLIWLVVVSTCVGICLLIPIVGRFQASSMVADAPIELLPDWLYLKWDQPVVFWTYAGILAILLVLPISWELPCKLHSQLVVLAAILFVLWNGFFVILPFALSKPLKLAIKSADKHSLSGASLECHSLLTGKKFYLRANDNGEISFRMLWRDTIEGEVWASGYSSCDLYISRKGHSAGGIIIIHQVPLDAEHPRSRDIMCSSNLTKEVPVYLPVEGQFPPLPYEDVYGPGQKFEHHPTWDYSLPWPKPTLK